jgi:hypothetical protein
MLCQHNNQKQTFVFIMLSTLLFNGYVWKRFTECIAPRNYQHICSCIQPMTVQWIPTYQVLNKCRRTNLLVFPCLSNCQMDFQCRILKNFTETNTVTWMWCHTVLAYKYWCVTRTYALHLQGGKISYMGKE